MKQFRVLIGNCEAVWNDLIGAGMEAILSDANEVAVTATPRLDEFLKLSKRKKFDLCFVFLCNLFGEPVEGKDAGLRSVEKVIESIAGLKYNCLMPVIAVCVRFKGPPLAKRACRAGADIFLEMPFGIPALRETVLIARHGQKPKARPASRRSAPQAS